MNKSFVFKPMRMDVKGKYIRFYFAKKAANMSSHHVVRDLQEPALLVADGEVCSLTLLENLLEWSPVVVALDGAFFELNKLGVKVDYWLGDFDEVNPEKTIEELGQEVTIIRAENQDQTDFEKGIDFLIKLGAPTINAVWATGKRMDHTLANFSTLTKYSNTEIILLNDWSRTYLLKPKFEKWYKKGEIVSLMPLPEAIGITTSGLKYSLENENLFWGKRFGTSNEAAEDGLVTITHKSGHLLLIEASEKPHN